MNQDTAARMAADGLDAAFWAGLLDDTFAVPRCSQCDRWFWPIEPRCGACGSTDIDWVPTEPAGTVYSWTRTWYPFVAVRAADLPYVVVLVELPAAGCIRMLGVLTGDETGLAVGASLAGTIAPPTRQTYGLSSVTWTLS
jgi:uncharacterized OB-fold protein